MSVYLQLRLCSFLSITLNVIDTLNEYQNNLDYNNGLGSSCFPK